MSGAGGSGLRAKFLPMFRFVTLLPLLLALLTACGGGGQSGGGGLLRGVPEDEEIMNGENGAENGDENGAGNGDDTGTGPDNGGEDRNGEDSPTPTFPL